MAKDALTLPAGSRLLHIGPHKTGTTTLQRALHANRTALEAHGVVYPGSRASHIRPALAITGSRGLLGARPASDQDWQRLVRQVAGAGDRTVVVSSEFFDMADPATATEIVERLGGPRVHVVVTLRPLAKILPSAWQQAVRGRLNLPYDKYLDGLFADPVTLRSAQTFWWRHRHGELVARWAEVVGAERLTVVVVDESDRLMLLHTFEALLGVPTGTLQPPAGRTNRSLTYAEIEFVRQIGREWKRRGWPERSYAKLVRRGVIEQLQLNRTPPADEQQIVTPAWAVERAAAAGADAARQIEALGVRVVGDLATLGAVPAVAAGADGDAVPTTLAIDAAVQAVVAAIDASGAARPGRRRKGAVPDTAPEPTARLAPARALAARVIRRR
jgi:hypothetical protein